MDTRVATGNLVVKSSHKVPRHCRASVGNIDGHENMDGLQGLLPARVGRVLLADLFPERCVASFCNSAFPAVGPEARLCLLFFLATKSQRHPGIGMHEQTNLFEL